MKIVESPFHFNSCSVCVSKKLLYHKNFKANAAEAEWGGREKGKIIAQQLNKRIMPNPAVN